MQRNIFLDKMHTNKYQICVKSFVPILFCDKPLFAYLSAFQVYFFYVLSGCSSSPHRRWRPILNFFNFAPLLKFKLAQQSLTLFTLFSARFFISFVIHTHHIFSMPIILLLLAPYGALSRLVTGDNLPIRPLIGT